MNKRVKEIRKSLGLSGEKFGEKIGVTKAAISNIEVGSRNVTDQIIKSICREFSVNEEWLRTGEGEMFLKQDTFSLDEYAKIHNLTDIEIEIIKNYIALPPETRKAIFSIFFPKDQQSDSNEGKSTNPCDEYPDDPDELCAPPDAGSDVG